MAKYEVRHSCGCVEVVNICGTNAHGERDSKIAWLESVPCRACHAEALKKEADAEGMAQLVGSEKQIAWALDIRAQMISLLKGEGEAKIERFCAQGKTTPERIAAGRAVVARAIGNIKAVEEARWFIDNRSVAIFFGSLIELALSLSDT